MFRIKSIDRAKRVAKSLKKTLNDAGFEFPLSACQNAVARMYGHEDWYGLMKAGIGDPSPDDSLVSTMEAIRRHEMQRQALYDMGVPSAVIPLVIDRIRPTGGARGERQTACPRFLVRAVYEKGDRRLDLGLQDLTRFVTDKLAMMGDAFFQQIEEKGAMAIYPIWNHLTPAVREFADREGFRLEGFREARRKFEAEVGDLSDKFVARMFRAHLRRLEILRLRADTAEKMLAMIERATFVENPTDMKMFTYVSGYAGGEDYTSTADGAYDGLLHDTYAETVEACPDFDTPEHEEWEHRYQEWEHKNTPPVVFGTYPVRWEGLDAGEVRDALIMVGEDGHYGESKHPQLEIDVEFMIENSLTSHYEEAIDNVVGLEDLTAFIKTWLPDAGLGNEADLALEKFIEEWNGLQTIVSHAADYGVIVPVRPGVTKEDAVAWARRDFELKRQEIVEREPWVLPGSEAAATMRP